MRRSSAMFTSGSRGAIRSAASSSQNFASSSTLSSVTSSRFITSTSSTSSISTLLQSQRAASSSGRGLTLRSSLPSANSTSTASFLLNRSISSKPRSPILETAAPRSSIYGIGNNSTSLLAPLTVAAAHAAGLATSASAKSESDESEESSSRNRPSATSSPPDTSHLLSSAPNLPPSAAAATPAPPIGRIRTFIKKYGAVGVVTYFSIYGATLASFYGAFSSGILFAGDVVGLIEKLHLGDLFDESLLTPKMGNFALAWIVTKFTEPLRFALTLGVTPAISRWWRGHHQHRVLAKAAKEASTKDAGDKTKA